MLYFRRPPLILGFSTPSLSNYRYPHLAFQTLVPLVLSFARLLNLAAVYDPPLKRQRDKLKKVLKKSSTYCNLYTDTVSEMLHSLGSRRKEQRVLFIPIISKIVCIQADNRIRVNQRFKFVIQTLNLLFGVVEYGAPNRTSRFFFK